MRDVSRRERSNDSFKILKYVLILLEQRKYFYIFYSYLKRNNTIVTKLKLSD